MEVDTQPQREKANGQQAGRATGASNRLSTQARPVGAHSQRAGGQPVTSKPARKAWDGTEELHKALSASREISQSWSLLQFVQELSSRGARLEGLEGAMENKRFYSFLGSIIVCAEAGHDEAALEEAIKQPASKKLASDYLALLQRIVYELK